MPFSVMVRKDVSTEYVLFDPAYDRIAEGASVSVDSVDARGRVYYVTAETADFGCVSKFGRLCPVYRRADPCPGHYYLNVTPVGVEFRSIDGKTGFLLDIGRCYLAGKPDIVPFNPSFVEIVSDTVILDKGPDRCFVINAKWHSRPLDDAYDILEAIALLIFDKIDAHTLGTAACIWKIIKPSYVSKDFILTPVTLGALVTNFVKKIYDDGTEFSGSIQGASIRHEEQETLLNILVGPIAAKAIMASGPQFKIKDMRYGRDTKTFTPILENGDTLHGYLKVNYGIDCMSWGEKSQEQKTVTSDSYRNTGTVGKISFF